MTTTTTTTFIQFHSPYSSLSLSPDHDHSCSTSEEVNVMLASKHPKKPAGRKKFRETRHPVYRGVRRRDSGNWVCEVREPNKKSRVWLGTYPTADMAARAHDVAVLAMRGPSACLNFADSLWRLPVPKSGNVKDIQKAAVKAAEAFRQAEESEENNEVLKNVFYIDEEAILGMPGFLADMAEGMMLPPPRMVGYDTCHADLEYSIDVSLWSF